MVRSTFTFTLAALLLALIYAVSALPAPSRRETGCAPPQLRSLGLGSTPACGFLDPPSALAEQKLERRASRQARAKARVAHGMPKATRAEKATGRVGARTQVLRPITAKKAQKIAERKDNRAMGKVQKQAAKIAGWKQKQKAPAYGLDEHGKLRKPQQEDFHPKAWDNKEKAKVAKAQRKADYAALSPADKEKHKLASAAASVAKQQKEGKDRQKRIATEATQKAARKAANKKAITTARAAYAQAEGMPARGAAYTSPQGHPYNGRDVRQSMFASELAKAKGGVGYNKFTGKPSKEAEKAPKDFKNRPNSPSSGGNVPLDGASPLPGNPLKEFPILHNKKTGYDGQKPAPTEARIITQKNAAGHTALIGKVGHPAGSDDHIAF